MSIDKAHPKRDDSHRSPILIFQGALNTLQSFTMLGTVDYVKAMFVWKGFTALYVWSIGLEWKLKLPAPFTWWHKVTSAHSSFLLDLYDTYRSSDIVYLERAGPELESRCLQAVGMACHSCRLGPHKSS